MKNKKILIILMLALCMGSLLSGCKNKKAGTAEFTPTPEVTVTPEPTPTPTITPNAQTTTYKSADKMVSIKLPDATWANRIDQPDMLSFQSPEAGDILILHGKGEEDMSVAVFPNTEDMAITLQQAAGMEAGKDFEIQNYTSSEVNGVGIYSYTVHILNVEKSDGCVYYVHKIYAGQNEYYDLTGSVKAEAALGDIQEAMDSFRITGKSPLKKAVAAQGEVQTDNSAGSSDLTSPSSSEISPEAMSDTNLSRTIYRNSDGHPLVIQPDGNGNWVDNQGNVYEFYNDQDVYDQNGVDYYYHGEAADVYYMPLPEE